MTAKILPFIVRDPVRPAPRPPIAPRETPLRVLVIDDSPEDRMAVRYALEAQNFILQEADKAETGIRLVEQEAPDCILLDYRLPDMDGIEVLTALRRPDGTLPCAIVMLTGTANGPTAMAALRAGALDYLNKNRVEEDSVRRAVTGAVDRFELQIERSAAEARNADLASIVTASGDAIMSLTRDGRVQTWNPAAEELFGYSAKEAFDRPTDELIVPPEQRAERQTLFQAVMSGKQAILTETKRHHRDGTLIDVEVNAAPIFDAEGRVVGIAQIVRDIRERKALEDTQQLLIRELNHRSKNLLSVIQAVAHQTVSSGEADFLARFDQRLRALAKNQDILANNSWQKVDLHLLVRAQLAHFRDLLDARIILTGPSVLVTADAAQSLGMALHELATNAAKYGAVSTPAGTVLITWSIAIGADGKRRFAMSWREQGGPPVAPPKHTGFGTRVLEKMVRMNLGADVALAYHAAGLEWSITCALGRISDH